MNTSLGIFMALLPILIPLYKHEYMIDKWSIGLLISSQGLGSLIGGLFFSYFSDSKGRKISLMSALLTCIVSSILCTMFDNFYIFLTLRLTAAIGYGGLMPVGITYLTEYLPDKSRAFYLIIMDVFRNVGGLAAILVAMFIGDNWRLFVLSPVPVFVLCVCLLIFIMPESSRYLLYKNKIEKLVKTLNKMCLVNGKSFNVEHAGSSQQENLETSNIKVKPNKKEVKIFNDLFCKKASTTYPLMMIWFFPAFGTGVFVFLPEIMLMQNFTMNDVYVVQSFTMIIPMVGSFLSSLFVDTFGRKQLISMCSMISGISLFIFIIIPEEKIKLYTYVVVIGCFALFMKVLKAVTQTYTPELYSTSIRTTALGFMSAIDRFAGILQPVIFTSIIYLSVKWAMVAFG